MSGSTRGPGSASSSAAWPPGAKGQGILISQATRHVRNAREHCRGLKFPTSAILVSQDRRCLRREALRRIDPHKAVQAAAEKIGLTVLPTVARSFEEFDAAFASMARQSAGAFILLGGEPFTTHSREVIALAARRKMPAIYDFAGMTRAGGLSSYGLSREYRYRLAATYVEKILKGARPSDLPVQQPTEFELTINRKTAKALGLTIPPSVLLRADQVIE